MTPVFAPITSHLFADRGFEAYALTVDGYGIWMHNHSKTKPLRTTYPLLPALILVLKCEQNDDHVMFSQHTFGVRESCHQHLKDRVK